MSDIVRVTVGEVYRQLLIAFSGNAAHNQATNRPTDLSSL